MAASARQHDARSFAAFYNEMWWSTKLTQVKSDTPHAPDSDPHSANYANVGCTASQHNQRPTIGVFLSHAIHQFLLDPISFVRNPSHVARIMSTKTLHFTEIHDLPPGDLIEFCIRLTRLIERRSARLIIRQFLKYRYRPGGAYMTTLAAAWRERLLAAYASSPSVAP